MIKISIRNAEAIKPEIEYIFRLWGKNRGVLISFTDEAGALAVGPENFQFNRSFLNGDFHSLQFNGTGFIVDDNGKIDPFASAFSLINSVQEYNAPARDNLGRFQYSRSIQHKAGYVQQNIVQQCFDTISKSLGFDTAREKSKFFLSHDIDLVNGAILEDGFHVIRRGRIDLFLRLLYNVAVSRPDWLNIDKIMKIESEYDCRSVFYWIVNKGKLNERERNADYSFHSKPIQRMFSLVEKSGFENGIHKSISPETFQQELKKYGTTPAGNRYHYLKFSLPQAYHDIEAAGLQLDASLGFAETIGFRNSYGLPFNPYNFEQRRPFHFVEVPLHIMDRTFFQYKKQSPREAEATIVGFFEQNLYNAVISILWHNNFFTNYKFNGYLQLYKNILAYIRDNSFKTISQREIIERYSIL